MRDVIDTAIRVLIGYSVLLLFTRLLGKKQLGQITYFSYITGIAMGDIVSEMIANEDVKIIDSVLGIVFWSLLTLLNEYIIIKSSKARKILNGEPVIVVKKGVIIKKALTSHKMNIDELIMLLHSKDIFSIKDVDYAILEPNGQLSVLKMHNKENVIKEDLNIPVKNRLYVPSKIIVDGKVIFKKLQESNLDTEWLNVQLKSAGLDSIEDVFYAELQEDGTLYINNNNSN
jgi:uncharacterized membrane protein YcaP (DUF421 family)